MRGMEQETVCIPKDKFEQLKRQAEIDVELLHQLMSSFKDIKEGQVRRVK